MLLIACCCRYCSYAPLLAALDAARKSLNDAGAHAYMFECVTPTVLHEFCNVSAPQPSQLYINCNTMYVFIKGNTLLPLIHCNTMHVLRLTPPTSARTFLFYTSHTLDWSPLLLQWTPRHSMHDCFGSTLAAVAMVDVAVDRLQALQAAASAPSSSSSSSTPAPAPGLLPVPHLENFLNVAAFRGDAPKAGASIGVDTAIGDTTEDDPDLQLPSKTPALSSAAKSRVWGRVAASVKKTKNAKQIPHDCGVYASHAPPALHFCSILRSFPRCIFVTSCRSYALSFSYRTPSLDDPCVTMALRDRAFLMELTSGFRWVCVCVCVCACAPTQLTRCSRNLCGLTRRPCVTVACPTQHIWQRCGGVSILN